MVSDQALALQVCRKEFPQRHAVVKQVKCLLGGKLYSTCGQTHRWAPRVLESHPCGSLHHFCGAFLLVFLWSVLFDLPDLEYIFGMSQDPPTHLLAKIGATAEAYG